MTPTQEYLERNPGLMAEMIADFQQRQNIVKAAKSKEPIDANVVENPNERAHLPYPKMLYNHGANTNLTVSNFEEHQAALQAGWREDPPVNQATVPAMATAAGSMDEERMDSLEQRMLSLEQMVAEIREAILERRKPGRPPNSRPE